MHLSISLNDHAIIYALFSRTSERHQLYHTWELTKRSARSTGARRSYHKSIVNRKRNILERKACRFLLDHLFGKIHSHLPAHLLQLLLLLRLYLFFLLNRTYILALTDAHQTELDTLSAGEIISKQFTADYPHIKKLHKRTDNASNFSSHSTPEAEKVICEKVSCCYIIVSYITVVSYCLAWYRFIDSGLQ